jgi:N-acetylneuraminic acid mutarotase
MRTRKWFGITWLLAALSGGCGGGGGDAPPPAPPSNNVGAGWVSIDSPTPDQATTDRVSIPVSGEAFINASCALSGCGDPVNTGVTITWINSTTGSTGSASQSFRICFFLVYFLCDNNWGASIPLAPGSNSIRITAADAHGNSGSATITIQRVPDVTAPTVVSTSPTHQAQGTSVDASLSATFNEPMNPATIDGTNFVLLDSNNNAIPGAVTYTGYTARFDPANFLSSASSYSARITRAARDAAGNPLASDFVWTFSTGAPQWLTTSTINAQAHPFHTAVWTGTRMIVWGQDGTGASYDPATDKWQSISQTGAPSRHTNAVWTGLEMLIWSSQTTIGGRYNPATDTWLPISTANAPSPRNDASVIWSGTEMIVWGGFDAAWTSLDNGASYDPLTDTWRPITATFAVKGRGSHTAVWTGTEMIIWGGGGGGFTTPGARYDPATNGWRPIAFSNSPTDRTGHTAVWTGTHMFIWGGDKHVSGDPLTNAGALYDPSTNRWQATTTVDSPSPRSGHSAIWTGSEMIVWGGVDSSRAAVSTGGRYNPVTNKWSPLETTGAPSARAGHTGVWTGSAMIVWGGSSNNMGGRFIP